LDPALIFTEPDTDRMVLLKCILKKEVGRVWPGLRWLRLGSSGRPCEQYAEPSCPIQCWEFLDDVNNY